MWSSGIGFVALKFLAYCLQIGQRSVILVKQVSLSLQYSFDTQGSYWPVNFPSPEKRSGHSLIQRQKLWGFPGGAVVENLPANAGDTVFEPWSGKIPHAAEQLGP